MILLKVFKDLHQDTISVDNENFKIFCCVVKLLNSSDDSCWMLSGLKRTFPYSWVGAIRAIEITNNQYFILGHISVFLEQMTLAQQLKSEMTVVTSQGQIKIEKPGN